MTVDVRARATRPGRHGVQNAFDGTNLLCGYLVLLFLVPANLTVSAMGAAGSPAGIYGIGLFVVWVLARIQRSVPRDHGGLRWAFAAMTIAYLLSYAAMSTRAAFTSELSNADRGLLRLVGWAGVVLVAMDGIRTRRSMRRIMEVIGVCGAIVGLIGLMQYLLKFDLVSYIHIPGLHPNNVIDDSELRSGLVRAAGTASHPIEYSVVMALMLAAAIPLATRHGMSRDQRRFWIGIAGVIIVAVPLAVARSGFVALFVVLAVMLPSWPKAWRRRFWIGLPFGLVAARLAFPGLLGTMLSLFTSTFGGTDNSTKGRTADYSAVAAYFRDRPWIGRGYSTFLPAIYRTLDNQLLGTLVETGIIGLLATFALFIVAIRVARNGRRAATDIDDRVLGQALVAWVAAGWAASATFDSFGFPMFSGMFFLGIGLCGAYCRVMSVGEGARVPTIPWPVPWWIRTGAIAVALVGMAGGLYAIKSTPPTWTSLVSTTVNGPPLTRSSNRYQQQVMTERLAETLVIMITNPQTRREFAAAGYGAHYEVNRGSGSLEMGTDVFGSGPVLNILVQSTDPTLTMDTMGVVFARIHDSLSNLQNDYGVAPGARATLTDVNVLANPAPLYGSHTRGYLAVAFIAIFGAMTLGRGVQAVRRRRTRSVAHLAAMSHTADLPVPV